jgi:hypothetical protein
MFVLECTIYLVCHLHDVVCILDACDAYDHVHFKYIHGLQIYMSIDDYYIILLVLCQNQRVIIRPS